MTDTELYPKEVGTSLFDALDRSYMYSSALKIAATMCATNFKWLFLHDLRHIPLLDFDIICGAAPRLSLQKRLSGESLDTEKSFLVKYSGSTTIRYFLEILRDFVIPPGTAAEILSRKERLADELSARSEQFLNRIRDAVNSPDPLQVLVSPRHTEVRDLFLEDLTQFSDDFRDKTLVDSLLDRATPIEELLSEKSTDPNVIDAFRSSYAFLQGVRPNFSFNNFHDALNAAVVVRLFNSRKLRASEKIIPVLISRTRAVRQLNDLSRKYLWRETSGEMPFLFTVPEFLVISEGIVARTEGRYKVAVDEAELLEAEAAGLVESCSELMQSYRGLVEKGVPSRSISVQDLPDYEWEMLLLRKRLFHKHWGAMFAPSLMASQRDKLEYLRLVLSKDWGPSLCQDDPEAFARSLNNFISELKSERPADYEICHLILTSRDPHREKIVVRSAFEFYVRDDDGSLLREITTGIPLKQFDSSVLDGDHCRQLVVLPAYLSCGAAVTFGTFRDSKVSSKRYVRLTWLHYGYGPRMASLCLDALGGALHDEDVVTARIFFQNDEVVIRDSLAVIKGSLVERLNEREGHDCFQVGCAGIFFFVDTQPLEGVEFQVGFTVEERQWSASLQAKLAQIVGETCEIPITTEYVEFVFTQARAFLRLPSDSSREPNSKVQDSDTYGGIHEGNEGLDLEG